MRLPKKIAVDLTPILPGGENGGAKVFVLELLRRLSAIEQDSQFVLLTQASSNDELASLDRSNIRRHVVLGLPASGNTRTQIRQIGARLARKLPKRIRAWLGDTVHRARDIAFSPSMLREQGIDLLFCPFTAPTYFEPGIPTVCTVYDLQYKTYSQFFSPDDNFHRERTFIEACRRASALTAISDYSRSSAIAHGNIEPARIRTIQLRMANRIPVAGQVDADTVLNRLGLARGCYLLYPANFWKHKNHEMLLTAFGIACKYGLPQEIRLVCTGAPGSRLDWLMRASHSMGLGHRVLFPGYLPNHELAVLMERCSAVVFPSLYEGFGLPVIEAMAAGVPVACSNVTSLPEVAGDAALLFDPRKPTEIARAMQTVASDESVRLQLIERGRVRAREFSDSDRMAREYWDIFCFALANAKHESSLTGAYSDGWAGARLTAQVMPASSEQALELEFLVPEWLPHEAIQVSSRRLGAGSGTFEKLDLRRGETATLSLPFTATGGAAEISIVPTFIPARTGHGEDVRELSIMLRRCSIVRSPPDARIDLFPESGR